jgi:tripartite-type tricarboxylate transporter receptor subunit TctC
MDVDRGGTVARIRSARRKFHDLGSTRVSEVRRRCDAIAAMSSSRTANSQPYPARAIRVIVPVAAGGPVDVITRLIVQQLSELWRSQFYVENLPTGAGNVATAVAAKAPSDGHTALTVTTALVINPGLYANLPYDPVKDFAPITVVGASPHVLVVYPALAATNVNELVSLVWNNPGKYSYASPGTGQLAGEMFRLECGLDLAHVPFNGAVPAITSTIAGHTPIAFMSLAAAASAIKGGNLRPLAITSTRRSVAFPEIPTMAEAGIPDQESAFWQGMVLPAGPPTEIVHRWQGDIVNIIALPDVQQRLMAMSFEPVGNSPEEFGALIESEIAKWRRVIERSKIKT